MEPSRLLLIEDEELSALTIKRIFRLAKVTHFTTLSEGMSWLDYNECDLCILDLNLPDSKGPDTFQTISKAHPFLRIVIYTGLPVTCSGCPIRPDHVHFAQKGDPQLIEKLREIGKLFDRAVA